MTVDREQILAAFQRSWAHIPLAQYDDIQKTAENALSALLAELEQAEKDCTAIEQNATFAENELSAAEARLAKVPALVEAITTISEVNAATLAKLFDPTADTPYEWARRIAREALAEWERDQTEAHA